MRDDAWAILGGLGAVLGVATLGGRVRPMSETPLNLYLRAPQGPQEPVIPPDGGLHYPSTARVRWAHQRNYSGPRGREPDSIVIHTVEGTADGAVEWFRDPRAEVSAHYTVARDGRVLHSVPEHLKAWHAGNAAWNRRAIGIEHGGRADDPETWTETMLIASADLAGWLAARYGFPLNRSTVVSHASIPRDPGKGTRTDPGPHFPWSRYLAYANSAKARYVKRPIPQA